MTGINTSLGINSVASTIAALGANGTQIVTTNTGAHVTGLEAAAYEFGAILASYPADAPPLTRNAAVFQVTDADGNTSMVSLNDLADDIRSQTGYDPLIEFSASFGNTNQGYSVADINFILNGLEDRYSSMTFSQLAIVEGSGDLSVSNNLSSQTQNAINQLRESFSNNLQGILDALDLNPDGVNLNDGLINDSAAISENAQLLSQLSTLSQTITTSMATVATAQANLAAAQAGKIPADRSAVELAQVALTDLQTEKTNLYGAPEAFINALNSVLNSGLTPYWGTAVGGWTDYAAQACGQYYNYPISGNDFRDYFSKVLQVVAPQLAADGQITQSECNSLKSQITNTITPAFTAINQRIAAATTVFNQATTSFSALNNAAITAAQTSLSAANASLSASQAQLTQLLSAYLDGGDLGEINDRLSGEGVTINAIITQINTQITSTQSNIVSLNTQILNAQSSAATGQSLSTSLAQAIATKTSNIATEQAALAAKQLAQTNLTQATNALTSLFSTPVSGFAQGLATGLQGLLSSISVPANQGQWTTLEAMALGATEGPGPNGSTSWMTTISSPAVGHFFMTSANLFAGASPARDTNTGNIDLEIALFNDRTYIAGALTWDQARAANPNITLDQWLWGGSGAPTVSARPSMFVELGGNQCPPFNGLISACGLNPNNPTDVAQFNAAMEQMVPGITAGPIVTAQQLLELRNFLTGPLATAQQNVTNAQQALTTATTAHTNAMSATASSASAVTAGVKAIESCTGLSFTSTAYNTYGQTISLALSQPLVDWNAINAPGGVAAWNLPSLMSLEGSSIAVCGSMLGGNQRSTALYSKSLAGLLGIPRPATSGPNGTYTQANIDAQYLLVKQKLAQVVPDFLVPTNPTDWTAATLTALQSALQNRANYLTPQGAVTACSAFAQTATASVGSLTQQRNTAVTGLPALQTQLQQLQGELLTLPQTTLQELFSSIEIETGVDLSRVIDPILTNGRMTKTDLNEIFTYLNQHLSPGATPFALIQNTAPASAAQITELSSDLNRFSVLDTTQNALKSVATALSQLTLSDLNASNFSIPIDSAVFSLPGEGEDAQLFSLNQVFERASTSSGVDLLEIFPNLADENGDVSWSNLNALIELFNQTGPSSEIPRLSSSIVASSQTLRTDLNAQITTLNTSIASLTPVINGLSGVRSTMSSGTVLYKQQAIVGMQVGGAAFSAGTYASSLAGLLGVPQIQPSGTYYSQAQMDSQYQLVVNKLNQLAPDLDFDIPTSASDWTATQLTSLQTQLEAIKSPLNTERSALNSQLSSLNQNITTFNSIITTSNISSSTIDAVTQGKLNKINAMVSNLSQAASSSGAISAVNSHTGTVYTNLPSLLAAAQTGMVGYRDIAVTGLQLNANMSSATYASSLAGLLGVPRAGSYYATQTDINNQYTAVRDALTALVPSFQCPANSSGWTASTLSSLKTALQAQKITLLTSEAAEAPTLNAAQTAILNSVSTIDLVAAKERLQNIQLEDVEVAVRTGAASADVIASARDFNPTAASVLSAAEINSQLEDGDLYVNSRGQFFLNRQPTNARDASVAAFVISGTSLNDKLANLMNKVNLNNTRIQMASYLSAATSAADLQIRIAEQRTQYGFADIMSEITGGSMSDSDITSSTDITTATGDFQSALKTAINNATNNQDLDTQNLQQLTSQIQANSTAMTQIIQAFEQMLKGLSQNLR